MTGGTTRTTVSPAATATLASAVSQLGDRLDQQEDRGAVVDLRTDGRGADDQRDEREHGPDDQGVEDPGGIGAAAAEADEQATMTGSSARAGP